MKHSFQVAAAFGIGLIVASGATLAQSYGRGRNVQFVDGATISPTNVIASGAANQFSCSSEASVCEINSATNATTMTNTVPAVDIGPTATPNTNDRLACVSYGASGSKTRPFCIDAEGDVGARIYTSNTASGATAYTCSTVGCRLNLGTPASRYMYDTGSGFAVSTNMSFSGDVSSTGVFNSSVTNGSNAYTCTNTGCRASLGSTSRYFYDTGASLASVSNFNVGGTMNVGSVSDGNYRFTVSGTPVNTVLLGVACSQAGVNDNCFYVLGPTVTGSHTVGLYTGSATSGLKQIMRNENNSNANAFASFEAQTSGSGGGDPQYTMTISGVANWSIGIDNSDSDKFKLSQSDRLGTNDLFTVTTGGDMTVTGGIKSSSTLSRGTISLSGGTGTATVLSGAVCVCSRTDAEAAVQCAVASTTLTATSGASTGTVAYVCL